MEPYQRASEALRSGEESPIQLLKGAGLTALGGGLINAGSKAMSKVIPAVGALINDYIPEEISKKGLSRIDPRFGKFIQGALDEGYSYDDLREFLGEKIKKSMPAKEDKGIIEQYSPELSSFIKEKIGSGMTPIQAGAVAQNDRRFSNAIKKMTQDHKVQWSQILESEFGKEPVSQSQNMQQQQNKPSDAKAALMQILQQINSSLGQK